MFQGIELDSTSLELRFPTVKLQRLLTTVEEWQSKRACTKKEFLSLIGQLQHATRIVKPGRSFLQRIIDLASAVKELHHHIRLRGSFKADRQWWDLFLQRWNGISMMTLLGSVHPAVTVTSDASENWGCGAFLDMGQWFQCQWHECDGVHITAKELLSHALCGERTGGGRQ